MFDDEVYSSRISVLIRVSLRVERNVAVVDSWTLPKDKTARLRTAMRTIRAGTRDRCMLFQRRLPVQIPVSTGRKNFIISRVESICVHRPMALGGLTPKRLANAETDDVSLDSFRRQIVSR